METETEEKALARIHIGELISIPTPPNGITPFYRCYVVTTAGQIWDADILGFGISKDRVRLLWNTARNIFTKREITTPLSTPA